MKNNQSLSFSLYPNPSQGWLFPVGNAESFDITLIAPDGKIVFQAARVKEKANIGHLPNGIYQYLVKADGKVSKGRLVLNR
jgi:hypothetical protein